MSGQIHPITLDYLVSEIEGDARGYLHIVQRFLESPDEMFESNVVLFQKVDDGKSVELSSILESSEEFVSVLTSEELVSLVEALCQIEAAKPLALSASEKKHRSRKGPRRK